MFNFTLFAANQVFIILFVFGFMFFVFLLIIGIIVWAIKRNKKNLIDWNSTAQKLNLQMPNPKKYEMSGFYNNCPIKIAIGVRGSSDSRETFTYCVTNFSQNLRFLLNIKSKSFLSGIFGSNQIKLGHSIFDDKFSVNCYDTNVLQQLLLSDFPSNQTQNLSEDLLMTVPSNSIVNITDEKVYIEKSGDSGNEILIKQMADLTTYLANRFESARKNFPLADWEKQMFTNWQNLAHQNNLQYDSKNICLQGNYQNFPCKISLKTDKAKWQTEIKFKFINSLMIGLKIMPENSLHQAMTWLGVQDIKAEIKEFDDVFIVKAKNIGFTKQLLQPQLCQQLLKLKSYSSDLQINDEEIFVTIDSIIGDQNMLKNCLDEIVFAAKMLKP